MMKTYFWFTVILCSIGAVPEQILVLSPKTKIPSSVDILVCSYEGIVLIPGLMGI